MIPHVAVLRVARPTSRLDQISRMYLDGLGFKVLAEFQNHEGFDGVIIGHPQHLYHLEFTTHVGGEVPVRPSKDNLLVFYLPEPTEWERCCANLRAAGFAEVASYNPFWDKAGRTFEDLDGYRIVLQNSVWNL